MKHLRPLLWLGVLALLGGLAVLVERLVVTDAEAIQALVDSAGKAVREGDFDALAATLDPEYQADGRDRAEAVAHVGRLWRQTRPAGLEADLGDIAIEGDQALAPADVTVKVLGRQVRVELDVVFRRTEEGWRIAAATPRGWSPSR